MSDRKILRPSTVATTSPLTWDLQPSSVDSTMAAIINAIGRAKRAFLFKGVLPTDGLRRIRVRQQPPLTPIPNYLEGGAEATAPCSGTGRLASFKALSNAAPTPLIGTAPVIFF